MSKKAVILGFVVSVFIALTTPITVLANRPPPSIFGGGENTLHSNENINAGASQPSHINTLSHGYEYGAFLGTLTVERLSRTVRIYGGATIEAMEKGAGHFSFTGLSYGNVGLIGHNRGARNGFFSFVRLLRDGDIIHLDLGGVSRSYEVFLSSIIDETDFAPLQQFGDNRLTLVTCVEYVRHQRRVVVAREI